MFNELSRLSNAENLLSRQPESCVPIFESWKNDIFLRNFRFSRNSLDFQWDFSSTSSSAGNLVGGLPAALSQCSRSNTKTRDFPGDRLEHKQKK